MSMTAAPAFWKEFGAATDRELVATAASGIEGSFEELVKRYQRPISAYVYRMVGDYDAALWMELWAQALRDEQLAETRAELDARWRRTIAEVVSYGQERGEFGPADPERFAVEALVSLPTGMVMLGGQAVGGGLGLDPRPARHDEHEADEVERDLAHDLHGRRSDLRGGAALSASRSRPSRAS